MLMTPMTPKVMARPMAASSSTEPSDMPYQTFWPTSQSASVASMPAIAACDVGLQVAFGRWRRPRDQHASASRSPLARDRVDGGVLCRRRRRSDDRTAAARACFDARLAPPASVSLASAASSSSSSVRRSATCRTASRRRRGARPGSGAAASARRSRSRTTRRRLLLTLILSRSPSAASPAASPVSGSSSRRIAAGRLGDDEDRVVGFADIEIAVGERFERARRGGIAGRRELVDDRLRSS